MNDMRRATDELYGDPDACSCDARKKLYDILAKDEESEDALPWSIDAMIAHNEACARYRDQL